MHHRLRPALDDRMQPTRLAYPSRRRIGDGRRLVWLLSGCLAATALAPATAQTPPPAGQAAATSPDAIKQREQELQAAREQQKKASELQEKLKADMAAIGQDRSKLNQQVIDLNITTAVADTDTSTDSC